MQFTARAQVGETLFSVPRHLLLSPRTCELPQRMGEDDWKRFNLYKGWSGLILCMMWEEAKGPESKWSEYFGKLYAPSLAMLNFLGQHGCRRPVRCREFGARDECLTRGTQSPLSCSGATRSWQSSKAVS